jgi:tRNA 5-methylaminomethyl-2-thiouridine biosynthesis bifunctional protein
MHKQLDDTHSSLDPATIDWRDGTPVSSHYDDVYYSRINGLDEARHVFLQHNDLPQRWRQCRQTAAHFIIIESGFGTGLNFLATWQLWQQTSTPGQSLHYISIEKHPLTSADIARTGQCWPQLQSECQRLCARYPLALPGLHPLQLDERVHLTLGFGDIVTVLDQLCDCDHPAQKAATAIKADAWFLDGFAPSRNPEMWSEPVFERMAALSKAGTSFATFTAAGQVKRGLTSAGFNVSKVAGYAHKRHMLRGVFSREDTTDCAPAEPAARRRHALTGLAWHTTARRPTAGTARDAVVIGAGLAGCHTARALAESGWQVTVVESGADSALAASGNPAGILYSRLSASHSEQSDFYLASYLIACRHYQRYFDRGELRSPRDGELSGMLQLATSDKEQRHIDALARRFADNEGLLQRLSAVQASELSNIDIEHPALLFPNSGWLRPRQVCHQLLQHPQITLRTGVAIDQLERSAGTWQLHSDAGECLRTSTCIICTGLDSSRFTQLAWLPTRAVGGQITLLPPTLLPSTVTPNSKLRPRLPLCHDGYVAPLPDGSLCCGASFRVNDASTELRQVDHQYNLTQLATHIPALLDPDSAQHLGSGSLDGRASVRCTSPDYLPIVGPVPAIAPFKKRFAPLGKDAKTDIHHQGAFIEGLFVNTGHGSKGLATTPVAAALLAAQLNHTPRPLPWRLVRAISPARFVIRDLIKGRA